MEGLTVALEEGLRDKVWESIQDRDDSNGFTNFFTDDILLFVIADRDCLRNLHSIFSVLGVDSGLSVSIGKSNLFLAKYVTDGKTSADEIRIKVGKLPVR